MSAADSYKPAITAYADRASADFDQARTDIQHIPGPPSVPPTTQPGIDQEKQRQTNLKNAQGALAAAFSQLGTAARMESDQTGRDGYASVVTLMNTIATTAESLCQQIRLMAAAPDTALMTSYAEVLTALAKLSPAAVWQQQQPPGGQN